MSIFIGSGGGNPAVSVSVNGGAATTAAAMNPSGPLVPGSGGWIGFNGGIINARLLYTASFDLPACFVNPSLRIALHADNEARDVLFNATSLNPGVPPQVPGPGAPTANFLGAPSVYTTVDPARFVPGVNTVVFDVRNAGGPGGISFTIEVAADNCPEGLLKVCKVAGPGIDIGKEFDFTANGVGFSAPAGAPPGGLCVQVGRFTVGSTVTVDETIPPDFRVTALSVSPPAREVAGSKDLGTGVVRVTIGAGVTEVSFTNRGPGFVEVCKEGTTAAVTGNFALTADGETFNVPVGACTPPIQVPGGPLTVSERARAGFALHHCETFPDPALVGCRTDRGEATVEVASGGVETQTVVTLVNEAVDFAPVDNVGNPTGGPSGSSGGSSGEAEILVPVVGVSDPVCLLSVGDLTRMLASNQITADQFVDMHTARLACAG